MTWHGLVNTWPRQWWQEIVLRIHQPQLRSSPVNRSPPVSVTMPPPLPGRNPFLDPAAPTLAAVIEQLPAADPSCGAMASAVRTACRVLGHTPHELPADLALLNRLMRKALPAAAGVTPRRWANVRSLLLRALALTGTSIMPGRRLHPLTPAWAALDGQLPERFMRAGLSRFMRWCSAESIEPAAVIGGALRPFPSGRAQRQPDPERLEHLPGDGAVVEPGGNQHPRLAADRDPVHPGPEPLCPAADQLSGGVPGRCRTLAGPARRRRRS